MKILYLSLTPSMRLEHPAGYSTHMRGVLRALAEMGHEIVVSIGGNGEATAPLADAVATGAGITAGITAGTTAGTIAGDASDPASGEQLKLLLPAGARHLIRDVRELALDRQAGPRLERLLDEHQIEAIYERAGLMQLAGLAIAARRRLPHLLEVNTPVEERRDFHGFPLYRVGRRRQRQQLALADQVVCVSTVLARYLVERGLAPDRVHVIPNAAWPEAYDLGDDARRAMRRQLGVGAGRVAIGFVGRFGYWHGMMELVEALAVVLRSVPEAHAVLVGDGQLMPEVRRFVDASGLAERFTLTGSIDWRQVPAHVAALDIGVMASTNWYCSPLKIFEYGAAGCAVVAPRVDPMTEVMEDGVDGVLVSPGDVGELTRVVTELARDSARRRRLGRHFQARVRSRFSWMQVGQRITELLAGSPRRG